MIPKNAKKMARLFESMATRLKELENGYSEKEMKIIEDFMNKSGEILLQETIKMKKKTKGKK
ncbi:MAG: hypothetical protein A2V52_00390 [Actinobacteria bacterium RBG_19FT_COMBO_54_7]|uniref:Uncharacterized protein n=1 Tax=Candidatus Solincola sediminis TaxID=1797199 RepID=A0A1F2WT07_9ACTN|nr:MAG: hypothetical protein A2Y75_07780 [Candidatus Solincola sediminis]OFW60209.1 MAG: hypothetical protein A2W01_08705 [Candidatus Solincola sediminis]OFW66952.1 MAG: hypothetical protein A2V52_00390 [Actinobacteria bacterium RBG_19FT_COMBO_54_7]